MHNMYITTYLDTGQAFKAANQAIGRLIRNTSDYGVLVLLDRRFATPRMRGLLPGWVRSAKRQWHARTVAELSPGLAAIAAFFAQKRGQKGEHK
jgi:Rad3-related DNA helicase